MHLSFFNYWFYIRNNFVIFTKVEENEGTISSGRGSTTLKKKHFCRVL